MKTLINLLTTLTLLSAAAADSGILDQAQPVLDLSIGGSAIGGNSEQSLAQVATAGVTGWLTAVGLPVAGSGTLLVEIQGVNHSVPNGVVFASQRFLGSSLPDVASDPNTFARLGLSQPVLVSAGDRFAIVVSALNPPTDIFGLFNGPVGNPYPGGNASYSSRPNPAGLWTPFGFDGRFDLPFQTYMTPVPEPHTVALMTFGGLVLVKLRSIKRSRGKQVSVLCDRSSGNHLAGGITALGYL